jgi:hypothetical protein
MVSVTLKRTLIGDIAVKNISISDHVKHCGCSHVDSTTYCVHMESINEVVQDVSSFIVCTDAGLVSNTNNVGNINGSVNNDSRFCSSNSCDHDGICIDSFACKYTCIHDVQNKCNTTCVNENESSNSSIVNKHIHSSHPISCTNNNELIPSHNVHPCNSSHSSVIDKYNPYDNDVFHECIDYVYVYNLKTYKYDGSSNQVICDNLEASNLDDIMVTDNSDVCIDVYVSDNMDFKNVSNNTSENQNVGSTSTCILNTSYLSNFDGMSDNNSIVNLTCAADRNSIASSVNGNISMDQKVIL